MSLVGKRISSLIIKQELSSGGMGFVVRAARADGLGENVALKIARPDAPGDPFFQNKIFLEAEILRKVNNEGVVKVLPMTWDAESHTYYARANTLPGRPWYYAMEYLSGPSLSKHLDQVRLLTVAEACAIGAKVAHALSYIHREAGYAHNDIKPENILFRQTLSKDTVFRPVLIDFGLASRLKVYEFDGATLRYSSLEKLDVISGEKPPETNDSQKSDIWSLGVILYRMLVGKEPFSGRSVDAIRTSIRNKRLNLISAEVRDAPHELDDLILRGCLTQHPVDRPSAQEVSQQLSKFVTDGRVEKDAQSRLKLW